MTINNLPPSSVQTTNTVDSGTATGADSTNTTTPAGSGDGTADTNVQGLDSAATQAASQTFDPQAAVNALSDTDITNILNGLAQQPSIAEYVAGLPANSSQQVQVGNNKYPAAILQILLEAVASEADPTQAQASSTQTPAASTTPVGGSSS